MVATHLKYEDFLENTDLIVLNNSENINKQYLNNKNQIFHIIDNIDILPDETKLWILNSLYENNGKTNGLADKLTQEKKISPDISQKIYDSIEKEFNKDSFKNNAKLPYSKWEYKPAEYVGFDDENYGTAFWCHYIESLSLFFVVIDIDAHNPETDISIETIESSIPEEFKATRTINTPSGGKHYYYLSKEPPSVNFDSNINIDYKTIFARNVERTKEGKYKNKSNGGYVVASFRWSYDGTKKEVYAHDPSSNNDILIVENTDVIVQSIMENLSQKGIDIKQNNKKDNGGSSYSAKIEYKLSDLENRTIKETFGGKIYEENNLSYGEDGIILLNEGNSVEIITQYSAEIISKTHGHHNNVLLALEGGLDHIGINKKIRKTILLNALELANDLTGEHENQINKSISKTGKKRGFPYLKKNFSNIESSINSIINIKNMFKPSIQKKDYELIKIQYNALVSRLFIDITNDDDRKIVLNYIDAYLNMHGIGLHERWNLIKDTFNRFEITEIGENLSKKLKKEDKKAHSLIYKGSIRLDNELNNILKNKNNNNKIHQINKLALDLDMQVSMTQIKNKSIIQPLINLIERPKALEEYKRRQIAYKYLRENENLKKTKDGAYIFDDQINNSYIAIDSNKLGNFLTIKYPILKLGIDATELDKILDLSGEFDELHNEYYIFNNGVLDVHERSFIETSDFSDYFSLRKMDCNLKLENSMINIEDQPSCLVDRVLREILIPNYKEEGENLDYNYYQDFLERLGSAFNTRIKDKKFACYYGKGDNGKDILIEILKMAFGDRCLLATMDILKDKTADLSQYDVVIIDELDKHSFKDSIAFIKRITGGEEEGTAKRILYQHDIFKPKNPSAFFLFTNEIPDVPLTDTAFYRREDALELQNRFTENPDTNKPDEFRADSSLKDKIKNSKEDNLEWLINAGLNAYYDRYDEEGYFKGFTKAQTADATKMIVSNTDPLSKFLRETYVVDEDKVETISNKEIILSYENYCMRENLICDTTGTLPIIMGNAVKNVFGDIKKPTATNTLYYLKAKNQRDNNTQYHIDSNYKWYQKKEEIPEDTYDNYKKVYSRIDELSNQGLIPTKKQLKEEFGHLDIEEILDKLESIELIFKGRR